MIACARLSCSNDTNAPLVLLDGAERAHAPDLKPGLVRSRLVAALISLALHAAPLSAIAYAWHAHTPVSAGEEVIELDMLMADEDVAPAPISEPTPEPPDPLAQAAAVDAAQAPDKKQEERHEKEDNAELHLHEEKPEPHLKTAPETVISVASAAPSATVSEQTRATLNASYRARLAKHLARFKRFPAGVRSGQTAGTVVVHFALNAEGRVETLALVKSSGSGVFDAEALAMIRRAEPFPRQPEALHDALSFTIPVSYRLRD